MPGAAARRGHQHARGGRGLRALLAVGLAGACLASLPWLAAGADAPEVTDVAALRVELGRQLFFDPLLSGDHSISCASCHKPERAFADDVAVSAGVAGRLGRRNTPTVLNTAARTSMFWDGRAETLEDQAIFPIENPLEMDLPVDQALQRLNADAGYRQAFQAAYGSPATARTLGRALAAYQKTLESGDSSYDRYARGDDAAMEASARRGRLLFIGKARCAECHSGEDFTSDRFRNIGLYNAATLDDRGRGEVTGNPADDGQFKVPSLRNVAVTAPYMHNGMFATLREVLDYYNDPDQVVPDAHGRDASMAGPLGLTAQEVDDLESFLVALTDERFAAAAGARQ